MIEPCYQRIGDRLRMARELRGYSQAKVAKLAGIKQSQVARVESAVYRCPLHVLVRLSMVLEIGNTLFRDLEKSS